MCPPGLLEKVLDITALSLQCHLKVKAGDHRTQIRKLLIEEFLVFLSAEGLLENELPLSRKMEALFNWIGIKQTDRPKGIAAIARKFKQRRGAY
jgi:hypothetical protein